MTENVLITIHSTQVTDDETETLEMTYPGKHRSLPEADVILYEEILPDDTGNAGNRTKNKMKIEDHTVRLTKKGILETEMFFEEGNVHQGFYKTPYGVFDMVIHTSQLEIQKTNDSIDIVNQYALELNGTHVSDCIMHIRIENTVT